MPLELVRQETIRELDGHAITVAHKDSLARRVMKNEEILQVRGADASEQAKRASDIARKSILLAGRLRHEFTGKAREIDSQLQGRLKAT